MYPCISLTALGAEKSIGHTADAIINPDFISTLDTAPTCGKFEPFSKVSGSPTNHAYVPSSNAGFTGLGAALKLPWKLL